ncbi:HvfC/BufC family peptide modification chaperone [Azospirillum sp. ST 5-10]|uniref:HvfC/BufC family peptide modification chaperone n=1 Tax=unclassified Azospirillum TaxID=2630922 RepID=UPI003F4A1F91
MLADRQRALRDWVLAGDGSVAAHLAPGLPAARLAVYRNTVLGSLAAVLAAAHPTARRLAGADAFDAAARRFAAASPPRQPALWAYGAGFADRLAGLVPGAPPWLADVARLDWAMHEALFAADAEPLDPQRLAAVPADRAAGLRLVPHPSVRLVRSPWPVHALWRGTDAGIPERHPEAVLVGRPAEEVLCARLAPADGAVAAALLAGATLAEAAAVRGGDPQAVLALLLRNALVAGYALGVPPHGGTP